MGWARPHIEKLRAGETVRFRPHGHSMVPLVHSGDLVTVEPVDAATIVPGDIVLCRVSGREFLHKVLAIRRGQVQIGNNKGHVNGWCSFGGIFGKCTHVEP